jgi:hypothetical protein
MVVIASLPLETSSSVFPSVRNSVTEVLSGLKTNTWSTPSANPTAVLMATKREKIAQPYFWNIR